MCSEGEMMTGYTEIIRKYAVNDSHAGLLQQADGTGEVGLSSNEVGQKLAVRFTLKVSQGRIKRARYQVFGCGFTIAACAVAAELIEGKKLSEMVHVDAAAINQGLGGLPEERNYCANLAVEALQAAVSSVRKKTVKVTTTFGLTESQHKPLVSTANPVYCALMSRPIAEGIQPEDHHLFACLFAVADREPVPLHRALGLSKQQLDRLMNAVFPEIDRKTVFSDSQLKTTTTPEINPEIRALLLSKSLLQSDGERCFLSEAMAHIIAARTAHPGHLWIAMGLFERPQLSAAIGRHLPLLLTLNNKGMRWKRFLFKQLCDQNGGTMCKAPNCSDCSDYALCFEN